MNRGFRSGTTHAPGLRSCGGVMRVNPYVNVRPIATVGAAALVVLIAAVASAQPATFTADATVGATKGTTTASVKVVVRRWSADAEREALLTAVKSGRAPSARQLLASAADAG